MWNVVTVSLRRQIVPGELFGRVNSAYRMIGWGLLPVAAITGGFVADAFGLRTPYLLGGIVIGIAAVTALPGHCFHAIRTQATHVKVAEKTSFESLDDKVNVALDTSE
jgi:MFS family permease